jgi:hypothetical protein
MPSNNTDPQVENFVKQVTSPGYRHHRVVPMLQLHEDKELHLPLVVLTGRENSDVEVKTYQDTLSQFKGKSPKKDEYSNWDELLEANRAYYTILYSARLPNDLSKKWFESKQQLEDTYTWDDIEILMAHYLTVRATQPHLVNLDMKDPNVFQIAIDRIKKLGTSSDFFLNGFTSHSSNQLIKFLVEERENLLRQIGTSGPH